MSNPLNIAMVGCGEIAVRNLEAVNASTRAMATACFDVNEPLAADLAEKAGGAKVYTDYDALLADPNVDAVIISTPHFLHAPQTLAALAAGKDVLVEKPIACNSVDGRKMIAAAIQAERKLGVNFVLRYAKSVQRARAIVQSGALGNILSWYLVSFSNKPVSYYSGGYSGRAKTDWRMKRETSGGGYLIMNVIHYLDFFRYITGQEVEKADGQVATLNSPEGVEVEDYAFVTLSITGGAVGAIAGGSMVPGRGPNSFLLLGNHGQIDFDLSRLKVFVDTDTDEFKGGEWAEITMDGDVWNDPRIEAVDAFCGWVQGETDFLSPAEDAIRALEICEQAYRSAGL